MWGTVLLIALMAAPDPVRIGVAILLMSRPRPMRNLFLYWVGAMATCLITVLSLLTLLRNFAPTLAHQLAEMAASPIARYGQIAGGALALALAATIAAGFSVRQAPATQAVSLAPMAVGTSTALLQRSAPIVSSGLSRRTKTALKGGPFWLVIVIGLGVPPELTAIVLTAILASGATVGTQVGAAIAFVVIMLALIEIPLISYLFKPAQTQAAMVALCEWVTVHRRRIVAVALAVAGVWLIVTGTLGA